MAATMTRVEPMKAELKLFAVSSALALVIPASSLFAGESHKDMERTNVNPAFARELMRSMEVMDKDMMAAPMTGAADHDFCAMMIPHHQGAIDMAKAILLHGSDPDVRRLVEDIIVTQQQEIEVMRLRLAAIHANSPVVQPINRPESRPSIPVSSHDRVYTADQTSGTVSVIDPEANKLL